MICIWKLFSNPESTPNVGVVYRTMESAKCHMNYGKLWRPARFWCYCNSWAMSSALLDWMALKRHELLKTIRPPKKKTLDFDFECHVILGKFHMSYCTIWKPLGIMWPWELFNKPKKTTDFQNQLILENVTENPWIWKSGWSWKVSHEPLETWRSPKLWCHVILATF